MLLFLKGNNLNSTTLIHESCIYGNSFKMGRFGYIGEGVKIGNNVTIGDYCKIMDNCEIGSDTELMDYVKLMPGTRIGSNCKLDDYVNTSGYCQIGNNVRIKRGSMIGQAVYIEDNVWIGSGVSTTRLKNPKDPNCFQEEIFIHPNAMIGSRALLLAGVTIGEGAIIGAGSLIVKNCEPYGTYIGHPARLVKQNV